MKVARVLLVALIAAGASAGAVAQWKWRDTNGVVQYSDRPPPASTPERSILERPFVFDSRRAAPPAAADAASAPATVAASRGPLDPELETRRRKLEAEKAEKDQKTQAERRADEQRTAALRADNCQRARSALRALEEGLRMVRTNAQGEREVLDDKGRAEETMRLRGAVTSNCG